VVCVVVFLSGRCCLLCYMHICWLLQCDVISSPLKYGENKNSAQQFIANVVYDIY